MMDAYTSGDPYLTFAKQAGAVPADATKQIHPRERELFKVCALAVQYGMGPQSLGQSLGQPQAMARELLRLHRETYPTFWRWSEAAVNHAMLRGWLQTVFGWRVHVGPRANPRSLANFPMQANGAEMLRLGVLPGDGAGDSGSAPRFTMPCWSRGRPTRSTTWWPTPKRRWPRPAGWCWTVSSCGPMRRSSATRIGTLIPEGGGCGKRSPRCWRSCRRLNWSRSSNSPPVGTCAVAATVLLHVTHTRTRIISSCFWYLEKIHAPHRPRTVQREASGQAATSAPAMQIRRVVFEGPNPWGVVVPGVPPCLPGYPVGRCGGAGSVVSGGDRQVTHG